MGQKIKAHASEGRCIFPTKKKWRDREIKLIDQSLLEQGAKQRRAAFAGNVFHFVTVTQFLQHPVQINLAGLT